MIFSCIRNCILGTIDLVKSTHIEDKWVYPPHILRLRLLSLGSPLQLHVGRAVLLPGRKSSVFSCLNDRRDPWVNLQWLQLCLPVENQLCHRNLSQMVLGWTVSCLHHILFKRHVRNLSYPSSVIPFSTIIMTVQTIGFQNAFHTHGSPCIFIRD